MSEEPAKPALIVNMHDVPEKVGVCAYPDADKVLVHGVKMLGKVATKEYFEDEPDPPKIFELIARSK